MDIRQGFWWAASLAILAFWVVWVVAVIDGSVYADPAFWLVLVAITAILTASHWLNRPSAADTELKELTMEAKKARLRSEIASHQKD